MKQQAFEDKYQREWSQFESMLVYLEERRNKSKASASQNLATEKNLSSFPESYRRMCHYLAMAREREYSTQLTERLNHLVLRGHQQLYRRKSSLKAAFIEFIVSGFPNSVRQQWKYCLVSATVFVVPGLIIMMLAMLYPELIYSILDPEQVNKFESMYDPARQVIGRLRDADSNFAMFGNYIEHNISLGFQSFAGGIIFGIGSLFFLFYNGIIFGSLSAHIITLRFNQTFFSFVIGHASFELTAIVLSGAAGLRLGYALIAPGRFTRGQSLKLAASSSIKIIYGVILMLMIAAFIEAFWSSSTLVPVYLKYLIGTALWVFVLFYFIRMGRQRGI